jgi:hypothetical protein
MGDSPTIPELLRAADAAAFAWNLDAENSYRSALSRANEKHDPADQIEAWIAFGAYLYRRARIRPSVLAYARAWDYARKGKDTKWSAAAAFGIFLCLDELGDKTGALAARLYLGQVSESEWAKTPRATQELLQQPESGLESSIAQIDAEIPNFEQRFLSGELRFDRAEDLVDLFERRARHRQESYLAQAEDSEQSAYQRQFLHRLILPALPLVVLIIISLAGWLPLKRWFLLVLLLLVAIYVVIWFTSLRAAWRWVSAHRKMRELDPVLDELSDSSSTHSQAVAILRKFGEQREPFALYLRSFEGEASQFLTPEGITRKGLSRIEFTENAIMRGGSAGGYIQPDRMVLAHEHGPSDFEQYIGSI